MAISHRNSSRRQSVVSKCQVRIHVTSAWGQEFMQLTGTMHAAGPMGLARGPAACMNHRFTVASQA